MLEPCGKSVAFEGVDGLGGDLGVAKRSEGFEQPSVPGTGKIAVGFLGDVQFVVAAEVQEGFCQGRVDPGGDWADGAHQLLLVALGGFVAARSVDDALDVVPSFPGGRIFFAAVRIVDDDPVVWVFRVWVNGHYLIVILRS